MMRVRTWIRFWILWTFMFMVYFGCKTLFDLIVFGWFDLRGTALLQALVMPFAQTVLLWFAFRLWRCWPQPPA